MAQSFDVEAFLTTVEGIENMAESIKLMCAGAKKSVRKKEGKDRKKKERDRKKEEEEEEKKAKLKAARKGYWTAEISFMKAIMKAIMAGPEANKDDIGFNDIETTCDALLDAYRTIAGIRNDETAKNYIDERMMWAKDIRQGVADIARGNDIAEYDVWLSKTEKFVELAFASSCKNLFAPYLKATKDEWKKPYAKMIGYIRNFKDVHGAIGGKFLGQASLKRAEDMTQKDLDYIVEKAEGYCADHPASNMSQEELAELREGLAKLLELPKLRELHRRREMEAHAHAAIDVDNLIKRLDNPSREKSVPKP